MIHLHKNFMNTLTFLFGPTSRRLFDGEHEEDL